MTRQERARNRERNLRAMKRYPQYWLTARQNEFLRKLRSGDFTRVEAVIKDMQLQYATMDRWLRQPIFKKFLRKSLAELMRRHNANEVLLLSNITQFVHQATSNPKQEIDDGVVRLALETMRRVDSLEKRITPPRSPKKPRLVHPSLPKDKAKSVFKVIENR